MRKEIRLKDLMYSGFDLLYYLDNQDRVYICIDDYTYSDNEDIEGWGEITDVFVYEYFKYYFVDRLTIFENGGFGLRCHQKELKGLECFY